MADFNGPPQASDGQHREPELIKDGDLLLVLLNEIGIRGGWKVGEWPEYNGASAIRLGGYAPRRECDFFWLCVTEDRESYGARCGKVVSLGVTITLKSIH
jgi:hypothetical protein